MIDDLGMWVTFAAIVVALGLYMWDEVPMELPTIHVLSNVTGVYFQSVANVRELLKRQLVEPVMWEQQMEEAVKGWQRISAFIETGPGKQLKAMMRRIDQEAWGKMTVLE